MLGECSSTKVCTRCSGRHHTTQHEAFASSASAVVEPGTSLTVHVAKRPPAECAAMLLATVRVLVVDRAGAYHAIRVLVDPESETSLIAESLTQRLRLLRTPVSVAIFGVGGLQTGYSRGRVALRISARSEQFALSVFTVLEEELPLLEETETALVWMHCLDERPRDAWVCGRLRESVRRRDLPTFDDRRKTARLSSSGKDEGHPAEARVGPPVGTVHHRFTCQIIEARSNHPGSVGHPRASLDGLHGDTRLDLWPSCKMDHLCSQPRSRHSEGYASSKMEARTWTRQPSGLRLPRCVSSGTLGASPVVDRTQLSPE